MGGPMGEWPIAWLWLLLGYEKVSSMSQSLHCSIEVTDMRLQLYFVLQLLHTTAMTVIKLSVILFLRRVFDANNWFRVSLWIVGAYISIWWFAAFGLGIFQSWSIASNWDPDRGTTAQHLENGMLSYFVRSYNL
jgi:hypothetical protein